MKRSRRLFRTLSWAVAFGLVGCESLLGLGDVELATCALNSDCPTNNECIFAHCSLACRTDEDCPRGARCLQTTTAAACVTPAAATCATDQECSNTRLMCDATQCRSRCDASDVELKCLKGQSCVGAACVGDDPTHDPPSTAGAAGIGQGGAGIGHGGAGAQGGASGGVGGVRDGGGGSGGGGNSAGGNGGHGGAAGGGSCLAKSMAPGCSCLTRIAWLPTALRFIAIDSRHKYAYVAGAAAAQVWRVLLADGSSTPLNALPAGVTNYVTGLAVNGVSDIEDVYWSTVDTVYQWNMTSGAPNASSMVSGLTAGQSLKGLGVNPNGAVVSYVDGPNQFIAFPLSVIDRTGKYVTAVTAMTPPGGFVVSGDAFYWARQLGQSGELCAATSDGGESQIPIPLYQAGNSADVAGTALYAKTVYFAARVGGQTDPKAPARLLSHSLSGGGSGTLCALPDAIDTDNFFMAADGAGVYVTTVDSKGASVLACAGTSTLTTLASGTTATALAATGDGNVYWVTKKESDAAGGAIYRCAR